MGIDLDATSIIIKPVLTEKTSLLKDSEKKTYVFQVAKDANKYMVIQAVKTLFNVNPLSCRIIRVKGKAKFNRAISKNSFRRGKGRSSSWKKALVTLQAGQKIDTFESV